MFDSWVLREHFQIDVELVAKAPVEEAPPEPTTPRSFAAAELLAVGVAAHPPPPEPTTAEHLAARLAADESFPIELGSRSLMPYSHLNAECAFQAQHVRCPPSTILTAITACSVNAVADCETNLFDGNAMGGPWSGTLHEWCEGHCAGPGRPIFDWTTPYLLVGLCNLHAGICSKHLC